MFGKKTLKRLENRTYHLRQNVWAASYRLHKLPEDTTDPEYKHLNELNEVMAENYDYILGMFDRAYAELMEFTKLPWYLKLLRS